MNSDLMRYMNRPAEVPKRDKAVSEHAKKVHDDVRTAAFMADANFALAGHIMEGAADLDDYRRRLAGDDPFLNAALGEIEMNALRQTTSIQRTMGNSWGF